MLSFIKSFKPFNSSSRHKLSLDYDNSIKKSKPFKALLVTKKMTGGRSNTGQITSRHRGARLQKLKIRIISYKRKQIDLLGTVKQLERDPIRKALIALIEYENKVFEYIIATEGLNVGDKIITSRNNSEMIKSSGSSFPLEMIPIGTSISCIELKPGAGAKIVRTAGSFAQLIAKENNMALLRLPSKEIRYVPLQCFATIGQVSNLIAKDIIYGNAGTLKARGRRPTVRGNAMNPVDHPHGGRGNKGIHPQSPWGKCAKGKKTRNKNKNSSYIVKRRK